MPLTGGGTLPERGKNLPPAGNAGALHWHGTASEEFGTPLA